MLPANFDASTANDARVQNAIAALEAWLSRHPDTTMIDPRIVSRDLRSTDPFLLSVALESLARNHEYRRVYMVSAPSGVLVGGEYDDPRSIPPRVTSGFNGDLDTSSAEIVPVLKRVNSHAGTGGR